MMIGGANKDKWKNQPKWNELPRPQRKIKIAMTFGYRTTKCLFFIIDHS